MRTLFGSTVATSLNLRYSVRYSVAICSRTFNPVVGMDLYSSIHEIAKKKGPVLLRPENYQHTHIYIMERKHPPLPSSSSSSSALLNLQGRIVRKKRVRQNQFWALAIRPQPTTIIEEDAPHSVTPATVTETSTAIPVYLPISSESSSLFYHPSVLFLESLVRVSAISVSASTTSTAGEKQNEEEEDDNKPEQPPKSHITTGNVLWIVQEIELIRCAPDIHAIDITIRGIFCERVLDPSVLLLSLHSEQAVVSLRELLVVEERKNHHNPPQEPSQKLSNKQRRRAIATILYNLQQERQNQVLSNISSKKNHHLSLSESSFVLTNVQMPPKRCQKPPRERLPHVKRRDMQFLQHLEQNIQTILPVPKRVMVEPPAPKRITNQTLLQQQQPPSQKAILNLPQPSSVLNGNPSQEQEYWRRTKYLHEKKFPQIQSILHILLQRQHPRMQQSSSSSSDSSLSFRHVLDVGGGRGDLALAIARTFPRVHVTVVDQNESSLRAGQAHIVRTMDNINNNNNNNNHDHTSTDDTTMITDKPGEVLRRMKKHKVSMNIATYRTLLWYWSQRERFDKVEEIFTFLRDMDYIVPETHRDAPEKVVILYGSEISSRNIQYSQAKQQLRDAHRHVILTYTNRNFNDLHSPEIERALTNMETLFLQMHEQGFVDEDMKSKMTRMNVFWISFHSLAHTNCVIVCVCDCFPLHGRTQQQMHFVNP